MGLPFTFSPIGAMPTDGYSYGIDVWYNTSNKITAVDWLDPVWAPEMGGRIGSTIMQTDAGMYHVTTTYRNPGVPVASDRLRGLPWPSVTAAWINMGLVMTVKEWTTTASHTPGNPITYWSTPEEPDYPQTVQLLIQGVNWDDGKASYAHLGAMAVQADIRRGCAQAYSATGLINDFLNNRGYDGYLFIPCSEFSQYTGFEPTKDWMVALHNATYHRNITWDGEGWNGTVRTNEVIFTPPGGFSGVMQLPELELPSRARVTYRPVAEGWR